MHLATQLPAAGDLAHFGFADFCATEKDPALTVGAANTDNGLAEAGECRIAVRTINEVARTRTSKVVNRRVDVVSQSGLRDQGKDSTQLDKERSHEVLPPLLHFLFEALNLRQHSTHCSCLNC